MALYRSLEYSQHARPLVNASFLKVEKSDHRPLDFGQPLEASLQLHVCEHCLDWSGRLADGVEREAFTVRIGSGRGQAGISGDGVQPGPRRGARIVIR